MLWFITALASAVDDPAVPPAEAAPDEPALPTVHFLLAVYDRSPDPRDRDKAVRYALRKSKTLTGGRDWGRVMCFRFEGEPDEQVLRKAAHKVGLQAEIRPVEDCSEPPHEAFLAPEPQVRIAVHTRTPVTQAEVKASVTRLLGVGGLGLIAVRTVDTPQSVFCLEFGQVPETSVLQFALASLPFATTSTEVVEDCKDALIPAE